MRITFKDTYDAVSRHVQPQKPSNEGGAATREFSNLLSSISPDHTQTPVDTAKSDVSAGLLIADDRGPMASFKFQEPELREPELDKMVPEPELPAVGNMTEQGVSAPAVLEVKRVKISDGLSEMRRNEKIGEIKGAVETLGLKHGVDPVLSLAVVSAESSFNHVAVSSDGHASKGLFQLLDSTGKELHSRAGLTGDYEPFNPEQNLELGVSYLRRLHDTFVKKTELPNKLATVPAANSASLEKLAVAAFNAGEGRVASAQQRALRDGLEPSHYEQIERYLPKSTQEYVRKVMRERDSFEGGSIG